MARGRLLRLEEALDDPEVWPAEREQIAACRSGERLRKEPGHGMEVLAFATPIAAREEGYAARGNA